MRQIELELSRGQDGKKSVSDRQGEITHRKIVKINRVLPVDVTKLYTKFGEDATNRT